MSRWFRHYAGMMRDEKLVRVAVKAKQPVERVIWVWGAILESAAEINDGGRYEFDAGEAAYFLRCDEAELVCILGELESCGRTAGGIVVRWSDRQFDSDSSKERQRRYRERRAAGDAVQERHDNVGGTSPRQSGDVTPPSRDGAVTPQETETETDKDTEEEEREGGAGAPPKMAFVGRVIRLKVADFDRWREQYHAIPDIRAELALADDYYSENPPKDGKWFFPVSRWMEKTHLEALKAKAPRNWRDEPEYRGVL